MEKTVFHTSFHIVEKEQQIFFEHTNKLI